MSFSERIYRLLLRAYPRGYRDRYAEPMEQLFRDRLGEVQSLADLAAFWVRTLADWTVSVPARYWEKIVPDPGHAPAAAPAEAAGFLALAAPARRCVFFARSEASSFSRREITVEHLLLGILREEPSLFAGTISDAVARRIEANEPAGRRVPPAEDLRLSDEAIRAIAAAKEAARSAGRREVLPRDLARGIARETNTLAARILREHDSDWS